MTLVNQSTLQLRKKKEAIDAVAGFAAMHTNVPDAMHDDFREITDELQSRDKAYEQFAASHKLETIVEDWLALGAKNPATALLHTLAFGWEKGLRPNELHCNPRNLYFDEIIITLFDIVGDTPDLHDAQIISANFSMRAQVEQDWVEKQVAGDKLTPALQSDQLKVFTANLAKEGGPKRLDFAFCPDGKGKQPLRYAVAYTL